MTVKVGYSEATEIAGGAFDMEAWGFFFFFFFFWQDCANFSIVEGL
jgi:hypothetical protein